ncbi:hypothetical protein MMC29_003204 [Sticta canariensis]|nr:hypothetical protein [Sticta canariensis]
MALPLPWTRLCALAVSSLTSPGPSSFGFLPLLHAPTPAKLLRSSERLYSDTDLTPAQQAVRGELRPSFAALKASGKRPFWRDAILDYYEGDIIKTAAYPPPPPPPAQPNPPAGGPSFTSPTGPSASGTPPGPPAPPSSPATQAHAAPAPPSSGAVPMTA